MTDRIASPRLAIPALGGIYEALSGWSYPLVRATAGLFLMPHGAQKLFGWYGGYGIAGTGEFFATQLGMTPGWLWALIAGLIEFFGGLALVLGFLTRPVAAAVVVFMAVAMFWVHIGNGFFVTNGGYEYALMWGLIALAILFRGGGERSLDRRLGWEF